MDKRSHIQTASAENGGAQLTQVNFAIVKKTSGFVVNASFLAPNGTDVVLISDDNGKVKNYVAVDDFVNAAVKLNLLASACQFKFTGLSTIAPAPFTGNIIAKNQRILASYVDKKVVTTAKEATLTTEIGLMQADATVPAALIVEKQAQLVAVQGFTAWLTSEIDRLNLALGNPPAGS